MALPLEETVFLSVARTFEHMNQKVAEFLRPYGLSPTQYNVLRILRGAGPVGVTCSQAAERMLNRDPDITRLMDRLEQRSLVARERSTQDRRVVLVRISEEGLTLLKQIDEPLQGFHQEVTKGLAPERLQALIDTLELIRQ